MEALQSKGTHRIPKPTKGMRMKLDSMDKVFDYLPAELDLPERWITTTGYHVFVEGSVISSDVTWTLEPILDSGIWLDGRFDLAEPTEGTILLLKYLHDPVYYTAQYVMGKWKIINWKDTKRGSEITLREFGPFELAYWMWISEHNEYENFCN